jgi:hypothetical protein
MSRDKGFIQYPQYCNYYRFTPGNNELSRQDLSNTLTESLLGTDQTDEVGFAHKARKLPSAPPSEEDLRDFVKHIQMEKSNSPISQRLRKKKRDPGSNHV